MIPQSILIGIKQIDQHASDVSDEGVGSTHIEATKFDILKQDSEVMLQSFVKKARKTAKKNSERIDEISNEIDMDGESMSESRYNKLQEELSELEKGTEILKYSQLMILQGFVV